MSIASDMIRGHTDTIILAQLMHSDSYGYQIVAELSSIIEISESTLYPILRRLESAGQLVTYTREHGGRLRRYYRITREGLGRLEGFNREWRQLKKIYAFIQGEDV